MPIPPYPKSYRCPQCNWHKTVMPKNDVLVRNHNWFESCPECGFDSLECSQPTVMDQVKAKLRDILGK